jgi:hypothetical protein
MPPTLSIDTAQPRDVKKPLLFECAWEVANKGQSPFSSALERVPIAGRITLNLFYGLLPQTRCSRRATIRIPDSPFRLRTPWVKPVGLCRNF